MEIPWLHFDNIVSPLLKLHIQFWQGIVDPCWYLGIIIELKDTLSKSTNGKTMEE